MVADLPEGGCAPRATMLLTCAYEGGEMAGKGITYAGSIVADRFFTVERYPKEGMLTHILGTKFFVGGLGNNVLQLARIDPEVPIHISSVVGLDDEGNRSVEMLSEFPEIDLSNVTREGETSVSLVMNSLETKQRTFFTRSASSRVWDESYLDWDAVDCDIFQMEYLLGLARCDAADEEYGTHAARILHDAREHGFKTSIDVVSRKHERSHEIIAAALRYVDYCIINEVETELATGIDVMDGDAIDLDRAREALGRMAEMGATTWAVIHTPRMAVGLDCATAEIVAVPSLPIAQEEIRGTTGAGDAFNTGVLYQAYKGSDLRRAMRFGTATAGLSLLGENGYCSLLPEDGIWAFEAERRAVDAC
jgi:sugar/nucleoside kinase (ribokinase family)